MSENGDRNFSMAELSKFCRDNDGRNLCFAGWAENILEDWLGWHWEHGNVYCVCNGADLVTLAVGWKVFERDLDDHVARYWGPPKDDGDCFYVSDLISTDRGGVGVAIQEFAQRHPGWRKLKLYARRHDRLKLMTAGLLERLCKSQAE